MVVWANHMRRVLAQIGEDATYTPVGGPPAADPVRGMFLSPYHTALGIVSSNKPQFACMADDVPALANGDTFQLRETSYQVVDTDADPVSGLTVCTLEKT